MNKLEQLADDCGTDKGSHQGFMSYYERYLPPATIPILLVELGVDKGNSLILWRKHFQHEAALIIGVDNDLSKMANIPYPRNIRVVEGDQADPGIAQTIESLHGKPNVIVDDASHEGPKTTESFEVWWPHLKPGGLYVIEDTHCSYNTDHYRSAGPPGTMYTMMEFLKLLADDVNWGIHGYDRFVPSYKDIASICFYPGICFIEKKGH